MTTQLRHDDFTVRTTEALLAPTVLYKAFSLLSGTITSSAREAIGVVNGKAGNNRLLPVTYAGITKVSAGAAVGSAGAPLTITTSGWFIGATSGTYTVGRSLASCASGDMLEAAVDFKVHHYLAT